MNTTGKSKALEAILFPADRLQALREFTGAPARFWSLYLETLCEICSARAGLIAAPHPENPDTWNVLAEVPPSVRPGSAGRLLREQIAAAAGACEENVSAVLHAAPATVIAVALQTGRSQDRCLALLHLESAGKATAAHKAEMLELINDIPRQYQVQKSAQETLLRQESFSAALDLMSLLNEQENFLAAAMTLCNELASRHACERVSLGWLKNRYIRIQAISHVDHFDKKMEAVQSLEKAMEESLDQDAEIVFPDRDEQTVNRDHEAYARLQDTANVCSVPLRLGTRAIAVCTLERNDKAFSEAEVRQVRLYCDQAVRRLEDLRTADRWIGALLAHKARTWLGALVGFEHTWAKVIGVTIAAALGIICFLPVTYRLEGTVMLRTDNVAFLTAPFNGHIDRVHVRVGDAVEQAQPLLDLDRKELVLEEAELTAEKGRYQRESEKARAANQLADMQIAAALRDQAAARLELVRHRLDKAAVRAPFDGIVVEGDQMERIGSPVQQGDMLMKIARIDGLYAELEVPESEIHHVELSQRGQIALASRPHDVFDLTVTRIEPAAVPREEGNVFLVHARLDNAAPSWWRPGMTGVAKIDAGRKTLLWIFTHRTVDFLRLKLWW